MAGIGKVCQNCGVKFIAYTHGKKFCGKECRAEYRAEHSCPGPSLENCLNCKFDDCIIAASTPPTLEETNDINSALGREEWKHND